MLSVLIPVYNYNVVSLVQELHRQADVAGLPYEILVSDDGSSKCFIEQYDILINLPCVRVLLNSNGGRAVNRNRLIAESVYPNLLFIDSDVSLPVDFILKYVSQIACNEEVVVGGILLASPEEENGKYYFRRYFGTKRESASLEERLADPYHHFNSCNFMASRKVFEKVIFNEIIKTYGHEDTDFSARLKDARISVRHIDNPLIHHPEDTFEQYLEKTRSAVANIVQLLQENQHPVYSNIRLVKVYSVLKRTRLLMLMGFVLNIFESFFLRMLKRRNPNLLFFDLYKLTLLLNLLKKEKASFTVYSSVQIEKPKTDPVSVDL